MSWNYTPLLEASALLGQVSPTVSLSSPADTATVTDTTPDLTFTGTDTDSDDVRYNIQIDTVNTFDSQGSAEDALSLSDNGSLSRSPVSSSFTDISFFCWVKIADNSDSHIIFTDGTSGGYGNGFSFYVNDSADGNYLALDIAYIADLESTLAITDNEWHFVGFTRRSSDNEWTIYLDGNSDDVGSTGPYSHDGNAKNVIGGWNNEGTPTADYSGSIARVGFWGSLLTSGNISSLYGGDAVSTIGSPLIDLPLDDSAAWGTNDGSGGNFTENGTLTEDTGGFDYFSGGPLIDAVSGTDAGFSGSPDNTDPFTSGQAVTYTVQSALSDTTTYYWRVRGIDPSGSNTYGAWATTRSFYVDTSAGGGVTPHFLTLLGVGT